MEYRIVKVNDPEELVLIQNIAKNTWPSTYGDILSADQITFMLKQFYANDVLEKKWKEGHEFFLLWYAEDAIGFVELEHHTIMKETKLHKLYLLPQQHGKGWGRILMEHSVQCSLNANSELLVLNVNRFNKALNFYEHYGFQRLKIEDIDIGSGYYMNDYVMGLNLVNFVNHKL